MNQYYAIELLSSDVAGGSTRPWKIRAEREGGEVVEVAVKLFNQKDLDQYQPVAKELFGHHLASHFGLAVPDFGLIELGDHFVSILPEKERTRLAGTHAGKKFASEWVPNAPLLDVAHLNQTMYAKYEIPLGMLKK